MPDGLSKVRVLVVDANAHMRTIVSSVLIAVGVGHVRECADGAEALKTLEHWQTDIAIVDYRMAPIDGLEFTRLVRNAEDSVNPYLPIIMLTGDASRQMVLDARDGRPVTLITAMLANKDAAGFYDAFRGLNPRVFTVRADAEAAASAEALAEKASAAGLTASACDTPEAAMDAALAGDGPAPHLIICGTLYFCGEILAASPETWPR